MHLALVLALLLTGPQGIAPSDQPASIQDNSFLLEGAYNQEPGVVQHISSFTRLSQSRDWGYTFTQEWPVPNHARHQLSYTVGAIRSGAFPASGAGIGDTFLNYRYQLIGSGKSRVAFAPRLSFLLSTGNPRDGHGMGGNGFQTDLPVSFVLNSRFVTHLNAGATVVPSARNGFGKRDSSVGYNLGQSFVWLARPRFNMLLETIWSSGQAVMGEHKTSPVHALLMSPGVRWAHNLSNGLQIVPGVAFPLGIGSSGSENGVLLYLSFEHRIWAERPRLQKCRLSE
jgi:hypothetical protein